MKRIPTNFVDTKKGKIMIDDLINKIVKNDNTDDDFVRMTFLVLLGTVIASVSHEYIPKEYYALVKVKRMISKFNWNDFTLKFFLSEIRKVLKDGRVREWPHGNLALLQYAYWEKVQRIIGPKYDPLSLMSPLMRNWTEPVAEKRDKYDYDYGLDVGMIDDNITYEYRVKKIAQEQAEKNKKSSTKKSTLSGKKKESNTLEASTSNVMDRIWHELKEIRKEMRRLPELCARLTTQHYFTIKMNKTGVFYRTSNMEEEENQYGDINESTNDGAFGHKEFVYQFDKDNYRTPSQGKINKQKDDDEGNVPYYCTPEYLNSFKGDWSDPIEVPEVSHEKAVTSLDTNKISSHESGHYNGVDEQVEKGIGKRKRTASRAIKSPFVVVKPIKRAKLSAKAIDGKKSSVDVDVIKSSVMFVRACERSKKHKATQIFNDGVTDALTTERACQILNCQWISGDVMNAYSSFLLEEAKYERYIIPTWRVTWLLEYRKDKNVNGNEYQKVSNSNEPVNRCMSEYFKDAKTYMALNKVNTHWVTVVMHKEKEEFQVLDSLMGKELDSTTRKLVEDLILQKQMQLDLCSIRMYPHGLLKPTTCLNKKMGTHVDYLFFIALKIGMAIHGIDLFHRSIDGSRELMIGQLIFALKNTLGEIKDKVIRIARRKK
ncbi:hypothetical protein ZWY2020_041489 [Hordeum vulgare]|nr:hypothetical protein ZWY2020_041489 [Hordeum vulgare]